MRRVIQLVVCKHEHMERVYALCDDGTIWSEEWDGKGQLIWVKKPDIPQDLVGDGHYEHEH